MEFEGKLRKNFGYNVALFKNRAGEKKRNMRLSFQWLRNLDRGIVTNVLLCIVSLAASSWVTWEVAKINFLSPVRLDPGVPFPHRGHDISKNILDEGTDNIWILVDFTAFEHYSSPEDFDDYRNHLLSAVTRNPKAQVRMLVYAPELAKESFLSQFKKSQWSQEGYRDEKTNSLERYKKYINYYTYTKHLIVEPGNAIGPGKCPTPSSFESFQQTVMCTQDSYCQEFSREGVQMRVVPYSVGKQPISFWLIPNNKIFFVFPDYLFPGPPSYERPSFVTRQREFVDTFTKQFDWIWNLPDSQRSEACYGNPFGLQPSAARLNRAGGSGTLASKRLPSATAARD